MAVIKGILLNQSNGLQHGGAPPPSHHTGLDSTVDTSQSTNLDSQILRNVVVRIHMRQTAYSAFQSIHRDECPEHKEAPCKQLVVKFKSLAFNANIVLHHIQFYTSLLLSES